MSLIFIDGPHFSAGESLSEALDCSAGQIVRITAPKEWTDAWITIQASTDGTEYNDVFDTQGRELLVKIVPGAAIVFNVNFTPAFAFVKFRSGTRERPVPQEALRTFAVTLLINDAAP
jgi:hypothetical protein